jgi:hypothetical protein
MPRWPLVVQAWCASMWQRSLLRCGAEGKLINQGLPARSLEASRFLTASSNLLVTLLVDRQPACPSHAQALTNLSDCGFDIDWSDEVLA